MSAVSSKWRETEIRTQHEDLNKSKKDKRSVGIACCRFNGSNPEILMVCKRYTYMYYIFAHSKYNSHSDDELIKMMNGMTIDEKYDLLSLNFMQIWYRIYLNKPHKSSSYVLAKNKFESTFVIDGGVRLTKLLAKSTSAAKIWEIPKGRKKNKNEPDIHCAIREFKEETGVSKKMYKVFPRATRTYSYVDAGVKYTNTYYFAYAKCVIEPKINFSSKEQIEEIADIKWMNMENIRLIDTDHRLEKFVKPIFNFMRKHARSV